MKINKDYYLKLEAGSIRTTYSDLVACYLLILNYFDKTIEVSSTGEKTFYDQLISRYGSVDKSIIIKDAKSRNLQIEVFNKQGCLLDFLSQNVREEKPVLLAVSELGEEKFKVVTGCLSNHDFIFINPSYKREFVIGSKLMLLLAKIPDGSWCISVNNLKKERKL